MRTRIYRQQKRELNTRRDEFFFQPPPPRFSPPLSLCVCMHKGCEFMKFKFKIGDYLCIHVKEIEMCL